MTEFFGYLMLAAIGFFFLAMVYKTIKTVIEYRRRKREKAERDKERKHRGEEE